MDRLEDKCGAFQTTEGAVHDPQMRSMWGSPYGGGGESGPSPLHGGKGKHRTCGGWVAVQRMPGQSA